MNRSHPEWAGRSLVDLVADQVAARAGNIAVRDAHCSLTYGELWERASLVAGSLARGGEAGGLVAVWSHREADLVPNLLGVLLAGAGYVALEPTYPLARLQHICRSAGLHTVLGREVPPALGLEALEVVGPGLVSGPLGPRTTGPAPGDLAYVMFTSGSTGRPNGVMIEHASVVNLLADMAAHPGLEPGQVMAALTTPAFDLSVPDLFLPLCTGATVALAEPGLARDPDALAAWMAKMKVDVAQATPTTWRTLLESGWTGLPHLRAVCGGEGYDASLARTLAGRVAELWNFYGPTETTVWSVCCRLGTQTADPVPMGFPLSNTECYVLDEDGAPVPDGEVGELYIGGVGVARGYWGQAALTAERFVPCPFPSVAGARMYRTGDLVRALAGGSLSFVGRTDHQVKVRGYRVELGEIESVLASQPGIAQAVAVARKGQGAEDALVAYVRPATDEIAPDEDAVRAALTAQLPHYMVPSSVVFLDAFPLTPNGKIDRAALPAPAARPSPGGAPCTPLEELVSATWCQVLGVGSVSLEDNFFELGGHSLSATRVALRLSQSLGLRVPVQLVMGSPVLRDQALGLLQILADLAISDGVWTDEALSVGAEDAT